MTTTGNVPVDGLRPVIRVLPAKLEYLLNSLTVTHLVLSTDTVTRQTLHSADTNKIFYVSSGRGWLDSGEAGPIWLEPGTLVVLPARSKLGDKAREERADCTNPTVMSVPNTQAFPLDSCQGSISAEGETKVEVIYGNFRAHYGENIEVFSTLSAPLVERFPEDRDLESKLQATLAELDSEQVGAASMAYTEFKQVLISVLRRALDSVHPWVEDFALLGNTKIARAIAAMQSNPGVPYTVGMLAQIADLSRSGFMAQFKEHVGTPPMSVLRDLRMRKAAILLLSGNVTLDNVIIEAGYLNKESFERAFRRAYGRPSADYANPPVATVPGASTMALAGGV
jgi:AraC family transcriptional activator of mtrCDE